MKSQKVILAGGSGFLGRSLAYDLISRTYKVVVLTRAPSKVGDKIAGVEYVSWDGRTLGGWQRQLDGAHAVINLTGKSVNCRYTPANRREIVESRVASVEVLGAAIEQCGSPPAVFIQAASLAIYGDAGAHICTEGTPPGSGFSADVCVKWEAAVARLPLTQTRRVLFRIGFALGHDGGALPTLARLTRLFLGGTVGSGRQYISWLHIHDLNRMFLRAIGDAKIEGTYNATGVQPVTNSEFMRELRRALNRPWSPPVPSPLVRLGARLMGTEAELALTGRRGAPARFKEQGFTFDYTQLRGAFKNLFAASGSAPVLTNMPSY